MSDFLRKTFVFGAITLAIGLAARYLLPLLAPFLLGLTVALLAEPMVATLAKHWKRGLAAGLGVSLTLAVLGIIVTFVGAVTVQQLGRVARQMPQLADSADQVLTTLQDSLTQLAQQAPERLRPRLQQAVLELTGDGTELTRQLAGQLPGVVTSALGRVGSGALGLGTGVVSAYLISGRLPALKTAVNANLPDSWQRKALPALRRVKSALGGWLKAQLKLCAVTWGIVSAGFLLLGIPGSISWAAVVAFIDAIPILGTGTVLIPWAVVCFIRQESTHAIGLLCVYGVAAVTRTVLEPKLVGRHLGLDPLATLIALYLGFHFWGIPGLLLTPIAAGAIKNILVCPKEG